MITECDSSSKEALSFDLTPAEPIPAERSQGTLLLIIRNFEVVRDESFELFRGKNLPDWGTVLHNLQNIVKCLRSHKILQIKVKASWLAEWDGRRMTESRILGWLGLESALQSGERVSRQVLGFKDKLKVAVMKKKLRKSEWLARWVLERLKTLRLIRSLRQKKMERSLQMQEQLRMDMEWEVEIFIPSFSVDAFKRSTTQYMDWFQNQYHCLWERSSLPLILVLPTLNEPLLALLQTKIKLTRPATIITPEIYAVFPPNLSLAAQVFLSYETMAKIQKAVGSRRAVLLGGCYSEGSYENLISVHLNAPIMRSMRKQG